MDINSVISIIPNVIAGLYEAIYVIDENQYYQVRYDGEELIVSVPNDKSELATIFANYKEDVYSHIEDESLKQVFVTKDGQEKLVIITTIENVKVLLVMEAAKNVKIDSNKAKLLIADDSQIICNFFKKSIGDEYEIIAAGDGFEAIEFLEQYKNDNLLAAFIDLNMPNKNGYEVLEYMRENNMLEQIPVSVISGEDSAESIEKVISLGAIDMLQKPFDAEAAKAIVNKTIQTHKNNT